MDEKLLNAVVFTGLYRPKKCWCNGYESNQHYDYCVPFMHEMGIVMVDTYHIHHSGDYEDFLKLREEEKDNKRIGVPFVAGLCCTYYSIIESVEELKRDFDFVLDLKEYHPADDEEFAKCADENKLARVPLWFECNLFRNGYKLVKNSPKMDINENHNKEGKIKMNSYIIVYELTISHSSDYPRKNEIVTKDFGNYYVEANNIKEAIDEFEKYTNDDKKRNEYYLWKRQYVLINVISLKETGK